MWEGKTVSLVFPAYNEEAGIRKAIEEFDATGVIDEILVVNNNSVDRTAEEVALTRARIVDEKTQGYGAALTRGLPQPSFAPPANPYYAEAPAHIMRYGVTAVLVPVDYPGKLPEGARHVAADDTFALYAVPAAARTPRIP